MRRHRIEPADHQSQVSDLSEMLRQPNRDMAEAILVRDGLSSGAAWLHELECIVDDVERELEWMNTKQNKMILFVTIGVFAWLYG